MKGFFFSCCSLFLISLRRATITMYYDWMNPLRSSNANTWDVVAAIVISYLNLLWHLLLSTTIVVDELLFLQRNEKKNDVFDNEWVCHFEVFLVVFNERQGEKERHTFGSPDMTRVRIPTDFGSGHLNFGLSVHYSFIIDCHLQPPIQSCTWIPIQHSALLFFCTW